MNRVIIIAEAGVNHNGDLGLAKKLVDVAAEAGADYVKFQTFKADKIVTKSAEKAEYQIQNMDDGDNSQYKMLKKLEMPEQWHNTLAAYAREKGTIFLSTAFDEESVDLLDRMDCPFFKIPSGEITNKPYLKHIASKNKPVVISTGMADMREVAAAVELFLSCGIKRQNISVLHCNTEYPTPMEDVNLHAMAAISRELNVEVGYSDHTLGIEVPIAAVALGARIIEKHFTLNRTMPGPDHVASLEPDELKAMVNAIRNVEQAISGNGQKEPSPSEAKNRDIVRKSLHFKHSLSKGSTIRESDLIALRPGNGLSPMLIDKIVGKIINRNVKANDRVTFNLLS